MTFGFFRTYFIENCNKTTLSTIVMSYVHQNGNQWWVGMTHKSDNFKYIKNTR